MNLPCYQYSQDIILFLHRIIERSCNLSKFAFVVSDHITITIINLNIWIGTSTKIVFEKGKEYVDLQYKKNRDYTGGGYGGLMVAKA